MIKPSLHRIRIISTLHSYFKKAGRVTQIGVCILVALLFLFVASMRPEKNKITNLNANHTANTSPHNELLLQADSVYQHLQLAEAGLQRNAFRMAFKGYRKMIDLGMIAKRGLLSIADFSLPSTQQRFFVVDMQRGKLLFKTWVAHGRNSGRIYATDFSNTPSSYKSSLGFYLTLQPYYGDKGYALKLKGMEKGINDKAYERAIVIHGADYVNGNMAATQGYLGRSLGCPALPFELNKKVIDTIREGSCFFIYHPNPAYLNNSNFLNG
ncbi:MAG: murein L,D-transpeptidase catalytic domain family protein [Chitinophagaceae bacterium]